MKVYSCISCIKSSFKSDFYITCQSYYGCKTTLTSWTMSFMIKNILVLLHAGLHFTAILHCCVIMLKSFEQLIKEANKFLFISCKNIFRFKLVFSYVVLTHFFQSFQHNVGWVQPCLNYFITSSKVLLMYLKLPGILVSCML